MANILQTRTLLLAFLASQFGPGLSPAQVQAQTSVVITRSVTIPTSVPSAAAQVPPDFVGFGFGQAWLPNYANQFSETLISSVAKRMASGVAPIIRLGGTVGDKFLWDPNQTQAVVPIDNEDPNASGTTFILGPSYFDGLKLFTDAKMTFQATLGKTLNLSSTVPIIKNAYAALGADRLAAIALGNEVEVEYGTASGYVTAALEIESSVIQALNLTGKERLIFEAVDTLSPDASTHVPYAVEEVWKAGMNANGFIKAAAEHWYQWNGGSNYTEAAFRSAIMNHSAITQRFIGYEESINYVRSVNTSVQYVLSETGTAIGSPSPPLFFCDAFGSALWSVDFNLASMVRYVSRVDDSGRPEAAHSSWTPDNSSDQVGPSVRAPFAVDPMMVDFIGKNPHSVVELAVADNPDLMAAYGGYLTSTGKLDRVALINMHPWKQSSGDTRLVRAFDLPLGSGIQQVRVQRLHADQGEEALGYDLGGAAGNVTWAGEQWTYKIDKGAGHYPTGMVEQENVTVSNGVAQILVPDTEAVIVWID